MRKFKAPVHFAAFKDGKKYIKNVGSKIKLTQQQIESRSLTGVPGEHTLTAEEIREGKSSRMACHLGKLFMLGKSWNGVWDSKEETPESRYAEAYYQLRERAIDRLETDYQGLVQATSGGERRAPAREEPRPVTPRASLGGAGTGLSEQYMRYWGRGSIPGRPAPSIRMTKQRIQRIKRWPVSDIEHFMRNAPLTRAAKNQLRDVLLERQRSGG
jgi:hypothetical protein